MGEQGPSLLLVFTMGMSLTGWEKTGILDRELRVYEQLLKTNKINSLFLFTYSSKDQEFSGTLPPGIKILKKPAIFAFKGGNLLYSLIAPYILRRKLKDIDLIKTNQMWGSWTAVRIKKLIKKPLIIRSGYTLSKNARKSISRWLYKIIERYAYKNCDQAIVSSDHDLRYISQKYHPRSIVLLPNYIDTDLFKPLDIVKDKDLLYVGRLSKEKNLEYTIDLAAHSGLSLDIYGSGPLESSLQAMITRLGATKQITLRGKVANSQLPKIYNSYRAYIQLSEYEGSPKTILEAMACGLPVIGSNVRGINEVVANDRNGLLIEKNDPENNSRIKAYLNSTNNSLKQHGRNARSFIENKFSFQKVVKLENTIMANLLKDKE